MGATIKNINTELPEDISFDTNFLIRYLASIIPSISFYNPAPYYNCLERLINNNVVCCVSDFVIEEICYKILRLYGEPAWEHNADKRQYPNRAHWAKYCEDNPQYLQPAYEKINDFMELLEKNLILILSYEKANKQDEDYISKKAIELMSVFTLISNDAFIIAHSIRFGISNFLTLDEKWKDVDNIVYYEM